MKKLLTILLLFISFSVFGQVSPVTPQFKGGSALDGIQYGWPGKTGLDTLLNAKYYRNNGLKAKATDFEGAGTTSDKFGIRDTLLKSNWIIKSTSTSLPGLTIDAENSDLTTPTIAVFKFNGSRVSAIGSAGGYFGRGVFANSGGDYASVFTDTTGTLISRKKADSNPVLRLINLSSGSTGDFLFAGDSTSTKFRITRQGGIIAPLLTDTTGLTKSIVWNPSTGKFYTQTGGGGGTYTGSGGIGLVGSDFRLATGSTVGNVTIKPPDGTHNLTFASDGGSGSTASLLFFNDVLKLSFVESGGGNAYTTYSDFSGDAQLDQGYANGSTSKKVTFGSNYPGIRTTDNVDHIGLNGAEIFPLTLGTQYAQIHQVDSIAKAKADSVKGTITGGGTTTNPLTLGYGLTGTSFDGSTAVTTKVDTSVIQTILNLFPKTDTRYKHDFTIAGHSIASNSNTTLATLSYGYGIALQSGTSTYDASGGSTFRVDTGATIQTVANFFPKGDTRYARTGSTGTVTSIATSTGITGGTITSTGTLKADTSVLQTVNNFHPLGNTFWVPTSRTVAGFALSSNVTLAALTATDATLTFSGSYNGSTARTVGLNLVNANTWTAAQTVQINNLTTAPTDAIYIQNNTASTSIVPNQYSGLFHLGARLWNTTAVAADNWTDYTIGVTTTSGATPASTLQFNTSLTTTSTPSYTPRMYLTNGGSLGLNITPNIVNNQTILRIGGNTISSITFDSGTTDKFQIYNDASTFNLYAFGGIGNMLTFTGSTGDAALIAGNFTIPVGKRLKVTEGTNGFAGQTTLVSGTKAITITGVTTSSRAFVTLVSQGGTVTTTQVYAAVCTSNTLTITALTNAGATDATDTSVLNYFIVN